MLPPDEKTRAKSKAMGKGAPMPNADNPKRCRALPCNVVRCYNNMPDCCRP
jgi:hypothetical protein